MPKGTIAAYWEGNSVLLALCSTLRNGKVDAISSHDGLSRVERRYLVRLRPATGTAVRMFADSRFGAGAWAFDRMFYTPSQRRAFPEIEVFEHMVLGDFAEAVFEVRLQTISSPFSKVLGRVAANPVYGVTEIPNADQVRALLPARFRKAFDRKNNGWWAARDAGAAAPRTLTLVGTDGRSKAMIVASPLGVTAGA